MIAQISFVDILNFNEAFYSLKLNKKQIIEYANQSC